MNRTFRVIWKRDDRGTWGVHCPGPFTHAEACTVLSKITPQAWRRDLLEEIKTDEDLYEEAQLNKLNAIKNGDWL